MSLRMPETGNATVSDGTDHARDRRPPTTQTRVELPDRVSCRL